MFGPVEHPFLDPLWRRIALVISCAIWTGVEFALGQDMWVYIVGGITVYGAWAFLFSYKGSDHPDRVPVKEPDKDAG